jgi:hypothetical protein
MTSLHSPYHLVPASGIKFFLLFQSELYFLYFSKKKVAYINCTSQYCTIVIFPHMHIMYFDQVYPLYYSFLFYALFPPF